MSLKNRRRIASHRAVSISNLSLRSAQDHTKLAKSLKNDFLLLSLKLED